MEMKAIDYLTKNIAESFICQMTSNQTWNTWNRFLKAVERVITKLISLI